MRWMGIGLALAALAAAPALADRLTLKNGDRVTGRMIKKDGQSVTFKTDLLGDVTVKWADITELITDKSMFVETPSGQTVEGAVKANADKVAVGGGSGTEIVAAPPVVLPTSKVGAIRNRDEQQKFERLVDPAFFDLWAGYVDIGLAAARGNASATTWTTAFNATRTSRADKTRFYLNEIYSRGVVNGNLTTTAKAVRAGGAYDRNTGGRLFVNLFNDYEHDAFQNLDLRFVAGAGAGFHFLRRERQSLELVSGGDYSHENFNVPLSPAVNGMGPITARNSAEAFWGDDYSYKISRLVALKQKVRVFHNLSAAGEYRSNLDLGIDFKLLKWLAWQISVSDRYLTNPAPGHKTNDLLITSGIRVSFAQ
jgi:hypothetical protein